MAEQGNIAAMREALVRVADIAEESFYDPERVREASCGNALALIVETARAALSAPARNCDRYATLKAAEEAFGAWCNGRHCEKCRFLGDDSAFCIAAWLFAKAEGGAE